jgi:hypothetical protein
MSTPDAAHAIAIRPGRGGDEWRVYFDHYRGRQQLHVRYWWRNAAGELRPGRGAAMPPTMLPWFRVAIEQAEAAALAAGMLDEESYEAAGLPLPIALGGG